MSRRSSGPSSLRDSATQGRPSITEMRQRRPSHMLSDSLLMSAVKPDGLAAGGGDSPKSSASAPLRRPSLTGERPVVGDDHLPNSALEDGSDEDEASYFGPARTLDEAARILGRRMSDAVRSGSRQPSSENVAGHDAASETTVISPDLVDRLRTLSLSRPSLPTSAPILANPKCSGYFVEPVSPSFTFCLVSMFTPF